MANILNPTQLESTADNFTNGSILEGRTLAITSDGAVITATVSASSGTELTYRFSDGLTIVDFTVPKTLVLAEGSEAVGIEYFLYFLKTAPSVLVSNISDWPLAEHVRIGRVIVQTAALVQSDGLLKQHNYTDHIEDSNNIGHALHVNNWIREQLGTYKDGVAPTITGSGTGTVTYAVTSGQVLQLHNQSFPAIIDPAPFKVVNDLTSAFKQITNIGAGILEDSTGTTLNNRHYNIVVWGVIAESGSGQSKLFINVPSGSYNNQSGAEEDGDRTTNFTIPIEYTGVGFLIQRLVMQNSGSTTFTVNNTFNLRGQTPSTVATVSQAQATTFPDSTFNVFNNADNTKVAKQDSSGIATATTRTFTYPDKDGTYAMLADVTGAVHATVGSAGAEFTTFQLAQAAGKTIVEQITDVTETTDFALSTDLFVISNGFAWNTGNVKITGTGAIKVRSSGDGNLITALTTVSKKTFDMQDTSQLDLTGFRTIDNSGNVGADTGIATFAVGTLLKSNNTKFILANGANCGFENVPVGSYITAYKVESGGASCSGFITNAAESVSVGGIYTGTFDQTQANPIIESVASAGIVLDDLFFVNSNPWISVAGVENRISNINNGSIDLTSSFRNAISNINIATLDMTDAACGNNAFSNIRVANNVTFGGDNNRGVNIFFGNNVTFNSGANNNRFLLTSLFGVVSDSGTGNELSDTADFENFNDSDLTVFNNADNTKIAAFSSASISTATTRTFTYPDKNGTFAMLSDASGAIYTTIGAGGDYETRQLAIADSVTEMELISNVSETVDSAPASGVDILMDLNGFTLNTGNTKLTALGDSIIKHIGNGKIVSALSTASKDAFDMQGTSQLDLSGVRTFDNSGNSSANTGIASFASGCKLISDNTTFNLHNGALCGFKSLPDNSTISNYRLIGGGTTCSGFITGGGSVNLTNGISSGTFSTSVNLITVSSSAGATINGFNCTGTQPLISLGGITHKISDITNASIDVTNSTISYFSNITSGTLDLSDAGCNDNYFSNLVVVNNVTLAGDRNKFVNAEFGGLFDISGDDNIGVNTKFLDDFGDSGTGNIFRNSAAPLEKGGVSGLLVKYNTTTSFTVTAGELELEGQVYTLGSDATVSPTIDSAYTLYYVYLDKSASTPSAPVFIGSSTAPTFSATKKGWYNGSDRMVGVYQSSASVTTITYFNIVDVSDKYIEIYLSGTETLATGMTPTGSWQVPGTTQSSNKTTVNAVSIRLFMTGRDTGAPAVVAAASEEWAAVQTSPFTDGVFRNAGELSVDMYTGFFPLGSSRDIRIAGGSDDNGALGAFVAGFGYKR